MNTRLTIGKNGQDSRFLKRNPLAALLVFLVALLAIGPIGSLADTGHPGLLFDAAGAPHVDTAPLRSRASLVPVKDVLRKAAAATGQPKLWPNGHAGAASPAALPLLPSFARSRDAVSFASLIASHNDPRRTNTPRAPPALPSLS